MSGVLAWLKANWISLLVGAIAGRFLLTRIV